MNSRFELLMARFFDGALTEEEDREFSGLLNAEPENLKRFIEQVRMERVLAGLSLEERVTDEAFLASVRRGIELSANESDARRFTARVARLVRTASRRNTRRSIRKRRVEVGAGIWAAAACAAMLLIGLLVWQGVRKPREAENINQKLVEKNDAKVFLPKPEPAAPPKEPPPSETNPSEPVVAVEPRLPEAVPEKSQPKPAVVEEPAPLAHVNDTLPAISGVVLGKITATNGLKVEIQHGSAAAATAAPNEEFRAGDTLAIGPSPVSPSEKHGPSYAELVLLEGSKLWLAADSVLRFKMENDRAFPLLASGQIKVDAVPRSAEHALQVRTAQGPVAEVLGTFFHIWADVPGKHVLLKVEEGTVLFSNCGKQRKVTVDEACNAEDGKAPGAPYQYRPHAAQIAGTVLDKITSKPLAGAQVYLSPVARRKVYQDLPPVVTDEQGRFKFGAAPEGAAFIAAVTATGGVGSGLVGRLASVRVQLAPGENKPVQIAVDRAPLVGGKVIDTSGTMLTGYQVRFISTGSDGQTNIVELADVKFPANEYRTVVTEGPGKYTPLVEQTGSVAKVVAPRSVQLHGDKPNVCPIEVQLAPSAVIKGRVVSRSGQPIQDEPGTNLEDPHAARTLVKLLLSNSLTQWTLAEPDGSFLFNTNLEAGNYELRVERFSFLSASKRFTLTAGQTCDCSISLDKIKGME